MPTYFRPSVYFEESLRPLSDTPSDPAESAAAFVGVVKGGPNVPTLITSWHMFQSLYGNISYETGDLAYAVYSYFSNGGSGCYVVRAVASDATSASLLAYDGTGVTTADEVFSVTAKAPGDWASHADSASRVFVTVRTSATAGRFDLVIDIGNSQFLASTETFVDLSMDPADPRYAVDVVNSPTIGSKYVTLTRSPNIVGNAAPGVMTKTVLVGGTNGTAPIDLVAATKTLEQVDRNLVINVPGASATDISGIVTWATALGRHFVVADVPKPVANETAAASVTAQTAFADAVGNSSHVAVYGPWVYLADPGSSAGGTRLTAPGGAVVAHYIRTDSTRGVHKAPAGIATTLTSVVAPYLLYDNTQQDSLATGGVNLIKPVPGAGVVIWGARTQSVGTIDKYVPVRRLLIAIKASLNELTRFAIFENIDAELRELVDSVVTKYLLTQFDLGALKGRSPAEAFFVRCDETNNPPAVEEAGQIIIDVGVALKTPAEFIIIRIGQQQTGAVASDSLEEI
jgi:phage tail sheath protein FI